MTISTLHRLVVSAAVVALPLQPAVLAQELTEPLLKLTATRDAAVELPQVRSTSEGEASWYGPGFFGNLTANGEIYDQYAMTAAHPSLPFGTWVYVTNLDNGAGVTVRINDRGPYAGGRIIDLSRSAAAAIGMIDSGVAYVAVEILN